MKEIDELVGNNYDKAIDNVITVLRRRLRIDIFQVSTRLAIEEICHDLGIRFDETGNIVTKDI